MKLSEVFLYFLEVEINLMLFPESFLVAPYIILVLQEICSFLVPLRVFLDFPGVFIKFHAFPGSILDILG